VVASAREHGLWVRGYISTAFGCPYEGMVPEERVRDVVVALLDTGIAEVSIGDTIGVATPGDIDRVLSRLLPDTGNEAIALHLHDTRGTALANVLAGLLAGITTFDSSAGGLGGCPFAPNATGNLATEDLVYMLDGLGIETGVDLPGIRRAVDGIAEVLGRLPPSAVHRAPPWPARRNPS